MNESNQESIFDFLMDPITWDGVKPTRIDTHISAVFLVGDKAYKLKKAVVFPFVDFSTLVLRQKACARELELNRLWSPALYLGLKPITLTDQGRLSLGGKGQVVEVLVEMHRFSEQSALTHLLAADQIDRTDIGALVQTLWQGYQQAPHHTESGGFVGMSEIVDNLEPSFGDHVPTALFAQWRRCLMAHQEKLEARRQAGLVRRCHGDLHLGNICRFDDRLIPFDALEFNETFAIIDMAYDLAFLIMDLQAHGYDHWAAMVFNRYLDVSGDDDAVGLMPFFVSLRAGVRAMVMIQSRQDAQARLYLNSAQAVLASVKPRLIAIGGFSGSGKSRLAAHLAPLLSNPGCAVIRSDAIRKRLMGVEQTIRLGPEGYTSEITTQVYTQLYRACARILEQGHPVIADAVFGREDERQIIENMAVQQGVDFKGLWLQVPQDIAADRINHRAFDASDATASVLAQQHQRDLGRITWAIIDTSGSESQTLDRAKAALGIS